MLIILQYNCSESQNFFIFDDEQSECRMLDTRSVVVKSVIICTLLCIAYMCCSAQ